ncbi:MAG: DUF6616 family protein [Methanococcaceae archaeon]
MYLYVGLWKAKPKWVELLQSERTDFIEHIGPAMEGLVNPEVELLGFAINEAETFSRADYRYIAIWKMKDKNSIEEFEKALEQSGWYRYFEQINGRGNIITPEAAFADMITI